MQRVNSFVLKSAIPPIDGHRLTPGKVSQAKYPGLEFYFHGGCIYAEADGLEPVQITDFTGVEMVGGLSLHDAKTLDDVCALLQDIKTLISAGAQAAPEEAAETAAEAKPKKRRGRPPKTA